VPARAVAASIAAIAAAALSGCAADGPAATSASLARAGYDQPGMHRQYGAPLAIGDGQVRTYIVLDQKSGGAAVELGVALDERALEALPEHGSGGGPHGNFVEYLPPLPAQNNTPFQLVELDWNPMGHGEPHDAPHFDFHFYTIDKAARDAIDPMDPAFAAQAAHEPDAASVPQFYANPAALLGVPAPAIAVPKMGMHWIDLRSPELQGMLGHPENYKPFTATFIYGAWDGEFIFMEPMITRAHILAKRDAADAVRDEIIPISTSASYPSGGFRPDAYRIAYDAQAKEFRIGLVMTGGN
ncbi:MAG TPA: hypothetical protein VFS05_11320, partial [Gemmatimonadaceae bacterium]|nr:hypothetical protein [Gemmatimonadaceae bacterium]